MMTQVWLEMVEILRRKFALSACLSLKAVQSICEDRNRGHLGFTEAIFGTGSLAVPVELKDKATKYLRWRRT